MLNYQRVSSRAMRKNLCHQLGTYNTYMRYFYILVYAHMTYTCLSWVWHRKIQCMYIYIYNYIISCIKKDKQKERDKEREREIYIYIYNAHCNRLAVCAQPPQDRKGYALNPFRTDAKPSSNFAVRPWVTIINRLLARIPRACLSASEEISISDPLVN